MTPFEIRLIAYAILGLGMMGVSGWAGHRLTALHYEAVISKDHDAQNLALQAAQQRVIDALNAQHAAEQKAEKDHESLVQADTTSRNAVLSSVRGLESALHLGGLLTAVGNPGGQGGPSAVSGGDSELESAIAETNSAVEKAVASCQHDSEHYAYILSIAPQNRQRVSP